MKSIFSFSMSLLVLIGTFSDAFVYITFKLNQDKIAEELCINLDEPELMCKGKCFLDEQLIKVNPIQSSGNKQTPPKFEKKDIPLFFKSSKPQNTQTSILNKHNWQPNQVSIIDYDKHLRGVFHPPQS